MGDKWSSATADVSNSLEAGSSTSAGGEHTADKPTSGIDINQQSGAYSITGKSTGSRPALVSKPTTAISHTKIQTQTFPDGSRSTYADTGFSPFSGDQNTGERNSSETGDGGSILSFTPTIDGGGDIQSLLSEVLNSTAQSPAWRLLGGSDYGFSESENLFDSQLEARLNTEFDSVETDDEAVALERWKSRLKHFLIMSSAGKPIYTRHGPESFISSYMGVIHTLISFYASSNAQVDSLRSIVAGRTRFAILIKGPVYLVAISQLHESDIQLQLQLEALYMQILSTLTLPTLEHMFLNRPSTDLRRVLHGTEPLLNGLADTFTRGSAASLLSSVECLKLRKSERHAINNVLLKNRSSSLLYGLIVANGRLVSVARPKKHSLHPSDLRLIFNMLFEADGIKAAGDGHWVPLCLPGFNKTGFLYMYASFLPVEEGRSRLKDGNTDVTTSKDPSIVLLLISAERDSFTQQQETQDAVLKSLKSMKSLALMRSAFMTSRPLISAITPNLPIHHFMYKSRTHVQYIQASHEPHFTTLYSRRKLHSLYSELHDSVHARGLGYGRKMLHIVNRDHIALAWCSQTYELYLVAHKSTNKRVLAKAAQLILAYVKREEERLFIIGGAIF